MALPSPDSLTIIPDAATITKARFISLLESRNSPAVPEASDVYDIIVSANVDVAFALAHFRIESQYGTSGYAAITNSWGNSLYDSGLTINTIPGPGGKYSPGNGYTYAAYANYHDAILDYVRYIHNYAEVRNYPTIYLTCKEWIRKSASVAMNYTNLIIQDMFKYEYPTGTFYEAGDKMIYTKDPNGTTSMISGTGRISRKYPVIHGMPLYKGTDGNLLKNYAGPTSDPSNLSTYAYFLGLVQGSTDWGMILIKTSAADVTGTLVYIKNIDKAKIIKV